MKISIDRIRSTSIRAVMERNHYATANYLGTYQHPNHPESRDWDVTLYRAADSLVFATNGDPVWDGTVGFDSLVAEYKIEMEVVL